MPNLNYIEGFSKLDRKEKINLLDSIFNKESGLIKDLDSHLHRTVEYQKLYNELSENTISNFYLPYSIAPNLLINNRFYFVPMVTEESSVVAAASAAAKYWAVRGGFKSKVLSYVKTGHIHFIWKGKFDKLIHFFISVKDELMLSVRHLTEKMNQRGGGIIDMELINKSNEIPDYFQLLVNFDTRDSMGANFINTVLEELAIVFKERIFQYNDFSLRERQIEIIMAILSNYAPECIVETEVESPIEKMSSGTDSMTPERFTQKFKMAVEIANHDIYRAVTHNKGIFNGMDAVAIATGNDFRAIEAQGHAWAASSGAYKGLTEVNIEDGIFSMKLKIPLSIGTVGGLTSLHPLAKRSLEILGNPDADGLMQIISSVGLASNFGAIKSLITTGIQKGHMRLHLSNILKRLHVSIEEEELASKHFKDKVVSYTSVENFILETRRKNS